MLCLMVESDSIPVRALPALHGKPIENARALGVPITDHASAILIHGRIFVRPIADVGAISRLLGAFLHGYCPRCGLPGRRFGDYIVHVAKQRRSAGSSFCLLFLAICTFPAAGALPLQYASLARLHRLERGPRYTGGPHPQHGLVAIEMRNYPCSVNRTQIAVTVRSQAGAPHREV